MRLCCPLRPSCQLIAAVSPQILITALTCLGACTGLTTHRPMGILVAWMTLPWAGRAMLRCRLCSHTCILPFWQNHTQSPLRIQ